MRSSSRDPRPGRPAGRAARQRRQGAPAPRTRAGDRRAATRACSRLEASPRRRAEPRGAARQVQLQPSCRPQDGQVTRRRFGSSMFLPSPAFVISHAAADARAMNSSTCGSMVTSLLTTFFGGRVDVPGNTTRDASCRIRACRARSWRDRRGRASPGRSEVGASLEQVSGERMAQQVRVDASRLEPGLLGEAAQDQEGAGPRQRAALGVQEQLRPVAPVEVRAAAREVAAERLGGRAGRSGRSRSLPPLPVTRTSRSSRSTPLFSSPTASETRSPAP